jgi:FMN phosphatase YigB (HAD superfamily)
MQAPARSYIATITLSTISRMPSSSRIVFLFDVDNTLLNNARVTADLKRYLDQQVGPERNQQYWEIFEQLRTELGYADYLGALQRYRIRYPRDPGLLTVSHFLVNYPFAMRLYPDSLDAVEHIKQWGEAVILSDGDVVFQPLKVERSGISEAVEGKVLIYIHKEQELDDVEARFPADHYVLIDDKVRILDAVKRIWRDKITTVFPRQGHYALDQKQVASFPPPDITIERIGDLVKLDASAFLPSTALH